MGDPSVPLQRVGMVVTLQVVLAVAAAARAAAAVLAAVMRAVSAAVVTAAVVVRVAEARALRWSAAADVKSPVPPLPLCSSRR
jgi:energy-converting hydrogenase Eha subunit C